MTTLSSEIKKAYTTLELEEGASAEDLKKAYNKLSLKYHPDKCNDAGAEEKCKSIMNAYTLIKEDLEM
ncbi:DnaJ domain-containing protein [Candidatus Cardinium hertigii]|uniref:DnaJ domain-containing protein n=1 Tax=Candidatus Cardinium hertigii TaxID=247481 RepID=UPI003D7C96A0